MSHGPSAVAPRWSARSRAIAWMATAAVLFATMNFFARLASDSAPWSVVACARAAIGAAVALLVARVRGRSLVVHNPRGIFVRSAVGTLAMLATFNALGRHALPLGDTTTLLNLTPVLVAILAPVVLAEPTSRRVWVAIPLSLTGVVLVVRPAVLFGGVAHTHDAGVAAGVALAASGISAFAMMSVRKLGQSETPEAVAFHFSVFATIVLFGVSLFDPRMPTPKGALYTLVAGLAAGVAQLAMTRAYALESAAVTSSISYLAVPTTALLSAVWLGERPTALALSGMGLVVTGGLSLTPFAQLMTSSRTVRRRSETRAEDSP